MIPLALFCLVMGLVVVTACWTPRMSRDRAMWRKAVWWARWEPKWRPVAREAERRVIRTLLVLALLWSAVGGLLAWAIVQGG